MTPNKDFEKALHDALSAITPADEPDGARDCPEPERVASHVRGTKIDQGVASHISSCPGCTRLASDVKRRQKLYETQKLAFTQAAGQKYSPASTFKETFQPFAWMLNWKALIPEVALVIAVVTVAFNYRSPSPPVEGSPTVTSATNSAVSTMVQIEKSDPRRPSESAVLLDKFGSQPELVQQIDPARVAQARLVVSQKKAAVASDPKLSDQWSDIEGKLQAYEFIAHYNSLRKQADGSAMLGRVADVEGKNGSITIKFDRDPITDTQDGKLLSTSAVETPGLNKIIILAPRKRWQLEAKDDFEVAAAADSRASQKPRD